MRLCMADLLARVRVGRGEKVTDAARFVKSRARAAGHADRRGLTRQRCATRRAARDLVARRARTRRAADRGRVPDARAPDAELRDGARLAAAAAVARIGRGRDAVLDASDVARGRARAVRLAAPVAARRAAAARLAAPAAVSRIAARVDALAGAELESRAARAACVARAVLDRAARDAAAAARDRIAPRIDALAAAVEGAGQADALARDARLGVLALDPAGPAVVVRARGVDATTRPRRAARRAPHGARALEPDAARRAGRAVGAVVPAAAAVLEAGREVDARVVAARLRREAGDARVALGVRGRSVRARSGVRRRVRSESVGIAGRTDARRVFGPRLARVVPGDRLAADRRRRHQHDRERDCAPVGSRIEHR